MSLHPASGFRVCSGCGRSFRPPYGRGWETYFGWWRCPTCTEPHDLQPEPHHHRGGPYR